MRYPEMDLYRQVAQYLNLKHPNCIYHFDLSGVHNPSRATRGTYKALNGRAWPDLFVAHRALVPGMTISYGGLFIELKTEGTRLSKANGDYASDHIKEQAERLSELEEHGYAAWFACGYDQAVRIIEDYMAGEL